MNQAQLAPPARGHRSAQLARAPEHVTPARVTVELSPRNHDSASSFVPIELELVAAPEASPNRTWTCPESFGSNWLDAITSTRCSEVLLTARLGDDTAAKHLVLELAELLAIKLTDSQPLIRVLFRPTTNAQRATRRHA
ncbi:MAG: hypothetical protein WDO74_05540 [Pseudomonadota bacterium]